MKYAWLALLAAAPLALPAHGDEFSKVNRSIRIRAGESVGDAATVNGSIKIEDSASAQDVSTVNGSISLGRNSSADEIESVNGGVSLGESARAGSVETVNGALRVAGSARVSGEVSAVNGSITAAQGADIAGKVSNVNGKMTFTGAHVGGGIETVNGDILVGADSRVEGGIRVKKPSRSWSRQPRKPRIVIAPGAIVTGELEFERPVELYVSDRAQIGQVHGATPIRFSGAEPAGESRASEVERAD